MYIFHSAHPFLFSKHLLKLWLLGLCLVGLAQAAPKKSKEVLEPYKGIEELRPQLSSYPLYTDNKGHYLALSETVGAPVFWGKGEVFFYIQKFSGSGTRIPSEKKGQPDIYLEYELSFWEPRTEHNEIVKRQNGEFYITCGQKHKTILAPVPAEEAKAILEKARFYRQRFKREPHLLVRDDMGTYYYVDKSSEENEKDFRVFIGKRGKLKPAKLKDIVQDSEGEIFATPNGTLRIIVGKNEVYWVQGRKKQALVKIPVGKNWNLPFVWNELGMYADKKTDTPCEDI
ncbi:MAG: hypothetical protein FWC28_06025 [Proteobacteria bacterium]|nr:hypothetical protein [Cystobacterineae bacterium]MCL2258813.1 hypothetical protein [Cystobacterineae bacterium]MCL2314790.1 hypothetical protein [Pseudomonadota bacterium]